MEGLYISSPLVGANLKNRTQIQRLYIVVDGHEGYSESEEGRREKGGKGS